MATMIPLNEVKARFSEMVGRARDHHEDIIISVHGEPAAVLMSMYEYESLKETLDILSDPEAMASLRAAEEERGQEVSAEQVHEELSPKHHRNVA